MQNVRPFYFTNEDFERDIRLIWSGAHKFRSVTDKIIILHLGFEVGDDYLELWKECKSIKEYAEKVGNLAHENDCWIRRSDPFMIYVIGFDESRQEIVAYYVTDAGKRILPTSTVGMNLEQFMISKTTPKVEEIPLPSYMVCAATHEPEDILRNFLNGNKLVWHDENGNRKTAPEKVWNQTIQKVLREGFQVFNAISRKYPVYMKPWRVTQLDKNGVSVKC